MITHLIKVIDTFEIIREDARQKRKDLINEYNLDEKNDFRIHIFEQLDNLIRSLDITLSLFVSGFSDKNLIYQLLFKNIELTTEEETIETQKINIRLEVFHRTGFIYTLSQVTEGGFRMLLRHIDSEDKATDSFYKVRNRLSKKLDNKESITKYKEALDLLGAIRNTIHNNGIYLPSNGTDDKIILYKSKKYVFEYGKPQRNSNFYILAEITQDIINMFYSIFEDKNIMKYALIKNPKYDRSALNY